MNWLLRHAMGIIFMAPDGDSGGGGGAPASGAAPGAAATAAAALASGAAPTPVATPTPAVGADGKPVAPAPGDPWFSSFKDPATKAWVESFKGAYPDAEAMATKALHLEKLLGADKAGKAVIPPKPDAPAAEWKEFYKKVGAVPEKPEEYKLPAGVDAKVAEALAKDPMLGRFQKYAHDIGMTQKMFADTLTWFANEGKGKVDTSQAAFAQQAEADWIDLKEKTWGKDFAAKHEQAKRAAATFIPGTPEERGAVLEKMEQALGTKGLMLLMQSIGSKFGEHAYVGGDGRVNGDGSMSPEAAKVRIDELEKDPAWRKSYLEGDADKKLEMKKLMEMAYPGSTAIR